MIGAIMMQYYLIKYKQIRNKRIQIKVDNTCVWYACIDKKSNNTIIQNILINHYTRIALSNNYEYCYWFKSKENAIADAISRGLIQKAKHLALAFNKPMKPFPLNVDFNKLFVHFIHR